MVPALPDKHRPYAADPMEGWILPLLLNGLVCVCGSHMSRNTADYAVFMEICGKSEKCTNISI